MRIIIFLLIVLLLALSACSGGGTITETISVTKTVTRTQTITVTETKTITIPTLNNEAIVQIWESEELIATGVAVGDGSQVLTVLNYEVDTPDSLNLTVMAPGNGEYEASVQVIDSRTSASLLQIEGGKLPSATIGNVQALLPEQQLFIREGYSSGGTAGFRATPVLYNTDQDRLPFTFGVHFPPEAMPEGIHRIGQGAVVTDERGNILGLVGPDFNTIFTHPHPFGFIPGVVSIESALGLLSPDATQLPWAKGPLMFMVNSSHGTLFKSGPLPEYEDITANLQDLLGKMGEPIPSAELPQDYYKILRRDLSPTEGILTVVYASPVDLRNADGVVVAQAKWVGFLYNTEEKPFLLLYGSGKLVIEGGFTFLGDLDNIVKLVSIIQQGLGVR